MRERIALNEVIATGYHVGSADYGAGFKITSSIVPCAGSGNRSIGGRCNVAGDSLQLIRCFGNFAGVVLT